MDFQSNCRQWCALARAFGSTSLLALIVCILLADPSIEPPTSRKDSSDSAFVRPLPFMGQLAVEETSRWHARAVYAEDAFQRATQNVTTIVSLRPFSRYFHPFVSNQSVCCSCSWVSLTPEWQSLCRQLIWHNRLITAVKAAIKRVDTSPLLKHHTGHDVARRWQMHLFSAAIFSSVAYSENPKTSAELLLILSREAYMQLNTTQREACTWSSFHQFRHSMCQPHTIQPQLRPWWLPCCPLTKSAVALIGWHFGDFKVLRHALMLSFAWYVHKENRHIMVVFKGTTPTIWQDILQDVTYAFTNWPLLNVDRAVDEVAQHLKPFLAQRYTLSFAGHSLGALLAEQCACAFNSTAFTFDNPGSVQGNMIDRCRQNVEAADTQAWVPHNNVFTMQSRRSHAINVLRKQWANTTIMFAGKPADASDFCLFLAVGSYRAWTVGPYQEWIGWFLTAAALLSRVVHIPHSLLYAASVILMIIWSFKTVQPEGSYVSRVLSVVAFIVKDVALMFGVVLVPYAAWMLSHHTIDAFVTSLESDVTWLSMHLAADQWRAVSIDMICFDFWHCFVSAWAYTFHFRRWTADVRRLQSVRVVFLPVVWLLESCRMTDNQFGFVASGILLVFIIIAVAVEKTNEYQLRSLHSELFPTAWYQGHNECPSALEMVQELKRRADADAIMPALPAAAPGHSAGTVEIAHNSAL